MAAKITNIKLTELPDNIKKTRNATHNVIFNTEGFDKTLGKVLLSVNNKISEINAETMETEITIKQNQKTLPLSEILRVKGHFIDVETGNISGSVLQEFSLNQNTQQYVKTDNLLKTSDVILGDYQNIANTWTHKDTVLEKMKQKGVEELYYSHDLIVGVEAGVALHYKIIKGKLTRQIEFTSLMMDSEHKNVLIKNFEKFGLKVPYDNNGHLVVKHEGLKKWVHYKSAKFKTFPNVKNFYFSRTQKWSSLDDDRIIAELDLLPDVKKNSINFDALSKSVQSQLEKAFYNNVNMHVYIKQLDENGNKIKENYLKSNQKSQNFDIKLNITINHKGEVEIKHVASDNYMKPYVNKLKQEAEARGLEVDIEALRRKCINDFEAPETEKTFFQRFIQGTKAVFSDEIASYVEGVQVSQKIAKNVWSEGAINQSTWHTKNSEHTKWPKYAQIHPLVGGVTDGAVDEIVGIPMAIKGVYEIVTDEEKQESLKKIFTKEGASQMMEGLIKDAKETLNDQDKAQHSGGKIVVSVFSSLGGLSLFSKVNNITEITDGASKLTKIIPDHKTNELFDKVKKAERHVDNDRIAKEFIEQVDEDLQAEIIEEFIEESAKKSKRLSFRELQAFWKRGNDFNTKSKDLGWYENNEIWMTHPTKVYPKGHKSAGKPRRFRLDSWDKDSGMIVSRKATNLDEINKDTFIKYCKEISEKYPPGSKLANFKIGDKLYGKYYLEIPDTNLKFDKINEYKKLAKDLDVELIFKPE